MVAWSGPGGWAAAACVLAPALVPATGRAAPDNCTLVSGTTTYLCSGNQSNGVVLGQSGIPTSASGFTVTNLTAGVFNTLAASLPTSNTGSFSLTFSSPLPISASSYGIVVGAAGQTYNFSGGYPAATPTLAAIANGTITAGQPDKPAVSVTSGAANGGGGGGDGGAGHGGSYPRDVAITLGGQPLDGGTITMGYGPPGTTVTPAVLGSATGGNGGGGATGVTVSGGRGGDGGAGGRVSATVIGA